MAITRLFRTQFCEECGGIRLATRGCRKCGLSAFSTETEQLQVNGSTTRLLEGTSKVTIKSPKRNT